MLVTTESANQMSVNELIETEEQLLQQLKSKSVRSSDSKYAFVKNQLWIVRDALIDSSEIAAQTY